MAEVKGKIICKKSDNKAFKLSDDNWYNLNDPVIPYLEKMAKGDEVTVTYEKKGTSRYVSKLTSAGVVEEQKAATTSTTGFACEVCGKELKDDKFKKCFMCNKKGLTKKEETGTGGKENYYNNPEKTASIQRGNALNAAAAVASGQQFETPDIAAQFTILLAERFLEWLRNE